LAIAVTTLRRGAPEQSHERRRLAGLILQCHRL
jgi:hypothetical protein